MKRLVIAIDCDDVLVPTAQSIIDNYNLTYGTRLTLAHMYQPATLAEWGTDSDDEAIERVNDFLRSEDHARIVPLKEAIDAIQMLASSHELHLITGRADFLSELTKRMLDNYFTDCFSSIEHTNYIVSSTSKALRRSKGQVCREVGADILIDDHLDHGRNALEAGVEKILLFGDYPWNQADRLPNGVVRCRDWPSVVREVTYAAG